MKITDFIGKTALVTGGGSGIGQALCVLLSRLGAKVVVVDIDPSKAYATVKAIQKEEGCCVFYQTDVSKAHEIEEAVQRTVAEFGRLDYLFNIAGLSLLTPTTEMNFKMWDRLIKVNLWGVINGTMAAYPVMVQQRGGHIVNMSSFGGLVSFPYALAYATTKFAVVGLSTSLREEAKPYGVKVSVVCPGFIRTPMFEDDKNFNKINRIDFIRQLPFPLMSPMKAAQQTLKGVMQNKSIITFSFYVRILWWLSRFHLSLLNPFYAKMRSDLMKVDTKQEIAKPAEAKPRPLEKVK